MKVYPQLDTRQKYTYNLTYSTKDENIPTIGCIGLKMKRKQNETASKLSIDGVNFCQITLKLKAFFILLCQVTGLLCYQKTAEELDPLSRMKVDKSGSQCDFSIQSKSANVCLAIDLYVVFFFLFQPANILLDENGHVRISDLGLACDFSKKKPHASV